MLALVGFGLGIIHSTRPCYEQYNSINVLTMSLSGMMQAKPTERKHGVRLPMPCWFLPIPMPGRAGRIEGGELRWQTLGLVGGVVLLLVAHTVRNEGEGEIIRIISARKATRKERIRYDQNRKKESL